MAWLVVVAALALAGTAHAGEAPGLERMYVLSCGESRTPDVSRWSPGVNVGQPWEFSNHCYLIRHARGLMLWDAGMSDAIAAMPDGLTAAGGALVLRVRKTLAAQLQELGVAPGDVTHLAFSHFHADHVGNANLFTGARLYIQALEYEAAFGPTPAKFNFAPANYEKLRANPVVKLTGDHDVFGDGTVTIVATPGHTPGHQSLLVRLPRRGPVFLSGDMVHFQDNWTHRRAPSMNFDREQSVRTMEKVAQLLAATGAELWINHDKQQSATIPKAPAYVE
jgi:glyoxylase-like metal-dependent hydrolase (beta-lactamase superfamily II)